MTTKHELNVLIAVITIAVNEAKTSWLEGIPTGHLWAELIQQVDLDIFMGIISLLKEGGWITEKYHLLKITPLGTQKALEFEKILSDAKKKEMSTAG